MRAVLKFSGISIAILIIAAGILGALLSYQELTAQSYPYQPMACTMDAKICPDGSYVGRVPPTCSFAPCPGETSNPPSTSCVTITSTLYFGSHDRYTGGDVTKLQSFLASRGYYQGQVIGIFGPVTMNAVMRFQRDNGLAPVGIVGPMTRAAIQRLSCGGNPPPTQSVSISSLTPSSGPTGTVVTVGGNGFTQDNRINFGNGVVLHVPSSQNGTVLTFTAPDTLTPACYYSMPACLMPSQQTTPGIYAVTVQNAFGTSNAQNFTVTSQNLNPVITTVAPQSARYGETITITGTNLGQSGVLHFYKDGQPYGSTGAGTVSSDGTRITFQLPEWIGAYCHPNSYCIAIAKRLAGGTYSIAVENSRGESNRIAFTVIE
jgi:hypothetical protein